MAKIIKFKQPLTLCHKHLEEIMRDVFEQGLVQNIQRNPYFDVMGFWVSSGDTSDETVNPEFQDNDYQYEVEMTFYIKLKEDC